MTTYNEKEISIQNENKGLSPVTRLPHRLERMSEDTRKWLYGDANAKDHFYRIGHTLTTFSPEDAAWFFKNEACCAMPCWKRMEIKEDGLLYVVR